MTDQDPDDFDDDDEDHFVPTGPIVPDALVALYEATLPRFDAFAGAFAALARRDRRAPVPAELRADARHLLADVRRIVGRELRLRQGLELGEATGWAEIEAKLALAHAALKSFENLYHEFDLATLTGWWRTQLEVEIRTE